MKAVGTLATGSCSKTREECSVYIRTIQLLLRFFSCFFFDRVYKKKIFLQVCRIFWGDAHLNEIGFMDLNGGGRKHIPAKRYVMRCFSQMFILCSGGRVNIIQWTIFGGRHFDGLVTIVLWTFNFLFLQSLR